MVTGCVGFFRFLSSLLTAVLMYHLAWVPTVMPSNHPPIKAFYQKHSSHTVDLLAKCHPYNPLWAQLGTVYTHTVVSTTNHCGLGTLSLSFIIHLQYVLCVCVCVGDLYGALGSPVRVCRTVVVGRRRELVQRVLYVLSYFIRCSDLQEHALPQAQADCPANPCPPQTTNPAPCPERTNDEPPACESEAAKPAPNPERTNEKTPPADTHSPELTSSSEGTITEALDSESTDSAPLSEPTGDGLGCAPEPPGETGPKDVFENPSSPAHRVRFVIGSPKEAESDRQPRDRMQPECGRGLHRKMPSRLLMDRLDSSDEEGPSHGQMCAGDEMQQCELPLPW